MNWIFSSFTETPKLEVQWSPAHYNKFITWGTNICVYEVGPVEETFTNTCFRISDDTTAQLLGTNTRYKNIRCVDINPEPQPDILLAVGLENGKVVLTTGPAAQDHLGVMGRELVPKSARQCNAVAWNPVFPNLIVCGLNKSRWNNSILLWDVLKSPDAKSNCVQPVVGAGLSGTVYSLSWFKTTPKCLVAGINNKQLKIFDLRDPVKNVSTTLTKAVNSVAVNPHNDCHIISHIDNEINIWDCRFFEKPLLTLNQDKWIVKVLWSPTKQNVFGSLQVNSTILNLYNIQQYNNEIDEMEPKILDRNVPLLIKDPVSFSWHPSQANRFLAFSESKLIDQKFCDRVTLNWSTRSQLVWNTASDSVKYLRSSDNFYKTFDDISDVTKKRAISGYGLVDELAANGDLAENNLLKNLWQWLNLSRSLTENGTIISRENRHPGVRKILKINAQMNNGFMKSQLVNENWIYLSVKDKTAKVYKSTDREEALKLCGWGFNQSSRLIKNQGSSLNSISLEKLENEGAYARAAAISIFNLRLRDAIKILRRESNNMRSKNNFNLLEKILTDYLTKKNCDWKQLCLKMKYSDPYLKAIIDFLLENDDSYECILNENGLELKDRVAFALRYLPDAKLIQYLDNLTKQCLIEGNLEGFFLTGASSDGVQLLRRYFDITGDVQSCCLIAIRAFSSKFILENSIQTWIESYRALLDAWKLWNQRARFDIAMGNSTKQKSTNQVYISCNFCGESISGHSRSLNKSKTSFGSFESTSDKLRNSSCPHCRKPLPHCAICLMYMGTSSGSSTPDSPISEGNDADGILSGFGSWFTWCQTCRHGGHTGHITHWFQKHTECPVTRCNCKCFSLDSSYSIGVKAA